MLNNNKYAFGILALPDIANKGELCSFFNLNDSFFFVYNIMFLGGHIVPAEMCTFKIFLT